MTTKIAADLRRRWSVPENVRPHKANGGYATRHPFSAGEHLYLN
jgi:hypothetical protein